MRIPYSVANGVPTDKLVLNNVVQGMSRGDVPAGPTILSWSTAKAFEPYAGAKSAEAFTEFIQARIQVWQAAEANRREKKKKKKKGKKKNKGKKKGTGAAGGWAPRSVSPLWPHTKHMALLSFYSVPDFCRWVGADGRSLRRRA